jgi:hypothetical protein
MGWLSRELIKLKKRRLHTMIIRFKFIYCHGANDAHTSGSSRSFSSDYKKTSCQIPPAAERQLFQNICTCIGVCPRPIIYNMQEAKSCKWILLRFCNLWDWTYYFCLGRAVQEKEEVCVEFVWCWSCVVHTISYVSRMEWYQFNAEPRLRSPFFPF